jgi:predicted aspartyl protease
MMKSIIRSQLAIAGPCLAGMLISTADAGELERTRAALGSDKLTAGTVCVLSGKSRFMGTDGRFTLAFDAEGRFIETIEGPISRSTGFDGDSAWEIDWNGIPRELLMGERDELLLRLWIASGLWAQAPADLRVDSAGERFHLAEGSMTAELAVNPETALPLSARYKRGSVSLAIELSDYQQKRGLHLPLKIESRSDDGEEQTFIVEEVSFDRGFDFRQPTARRQPATFDAAAPTSLEIQVAPTQHLMVRGIVNGQDVGWFIFDSGAGANVLSLAAAEAVGAEAVGSTPVLGVGGSVEGTVYRTETLTVGPLTIAEPLMIGVDLSPYEPHLGVQLGGIIGYEALVHAVVTYEFDGPTITMSEPATHRLDDASWRDLLLYNRTSHVEAEFEGHRGVFLLDTGAANASVGIYAPAVERLNLLAARETTESQVAGGGGALPAQRGKLARFEIAGKEYRDVDAVFATTMEGVYADPYVIGTVGGKILSDFTLVLDYSRNRIAFVPRQATGVAHGAELGLQNSASGAAAE